MAWSWFGIQTALTLKPFKSKGSATRRSAISLAIPFAPGYPGCTISSTTCRNWDWLVSDCLWKPATAKTRSIFLVKLWLKLFQLTRCANTMWGSYDPIFVQNCTATEMKAGISLKWNNPIPTMVRGFSSSNNFVGWIWRLEANRSLKNLLLIWPQRFFELIGISLDP